MSVLVVGPSLSPVLSIELASVAVPLIVCVWVIAITKVSVIVWVATVTGISVIVWSVVLSVIFVTCFNRGVLR